jgi:hypothetical protein
VRREALGRAVQMAKAFGAHDKGVCSPLAVRRGTHAGQLSDNTEVPISFTCGNGHLDLAEMELGVPRAPTRQDLAPRIGDWRAWFEWGSHNFADGSTVPPAWYLQRDEDEPISLQGVGLHLDELRSWLEREADLLTAKAVLWHYRPETIPLSMGKVMAPRVVR